MNITASFNAFGSIIASIDGIEMTVPNDPANRHRQMIAEWEAAGNTIAAYVAPPVPIPNRVGANQFGKQLVALGLMDQVTAWVNAQDAATQWSFNRSATFVRTDAMMQTGFAALGFTSEQIDQFFLAASLL